MGRREKGVGRSLASFLCSLGPAWISQLKGRNMFSLWGSTGSHDVLRAMMIQGHPYKLISFLAVEALAHSDARRHCVRATGPES